MKKLLAILLTLLLLACLSPAAWATIDLSGSSRGALVVDDDDLLSQSEEQELLALAEEISARQECDVVLLTVYSLDGKSAMDYADDYFDYNGYGYGSQRSGLLLLVSMEDRDWWISTRGEAIQAFTDDGIQYLADKFLSDLSGGWYADAFRSYFETADTMLSAYNGTLSDAELAAFQEDFADFTGDDTNRAPKQKPLVLSVILALVLGFVLAFIPMLAMKAQIQTVRRNDAAANYERPSSLSMFRNRDIYLYANTTSRVIETNRSGGGGSSTHISSSGATHGGGGGKF